METTKATRQRLIPQVRRRQNNSDVTPLLLLSLQTVGPAVAVGQGDSIVPERVQVRREEPSVAIEVEGLPAFARLRDLRFALRGVALGLVAMRCVALWICGSMVAEFADTTETRRVQF